MCHEYCTRTVHSGTAVHRQVSCLSLYAIVILFDSSAPASLSHQHSSAQPSSASPSRNPAKQATHRRNPAGSGVRWLRGSVGLVGRVGVGSLASPFYSSYSIALALLGAVTDQTGDTITTPSPPPYDSRALPGPRPPTPRRTPPTSSDQFTSTPPSLPPTPPPTPTRRHATPTTPKSDARSPSRATEPKQSSATSASCAAKPTS